MANRTISMSEDLSRYLVEVAVDELEVMKRAREETAQRPDSIMQVSPEQGAFMTWLVRVLGVRRAIELGTYTGYSALAVARALGPDGLLVCCELSEEHAAIARRYFAAANLAERIDLRVAPAIETLDALRESGAGTFDFAFIDADKESYHVYYERCLELVRAGGLIAIDNVLWEGKVVDANADDPSTRAIRALNDQVFRDPRVDACMIPIGDGLTLARRR